MSYNIFLVDSENYIELDCDGIDMSTVFSVADIKDISARADTITKEISFKGTKTNNRAFGSMFHLNKVTDSSLDNKLFFNYNPLILVDCFVYEDGMLLLKGNIRVLEVDVSKGSILYGTVITGTFIALKGIIGDKVLYNSNDKWPDTNATNTGLDFSDLKHHYSQTNIKASWGATINASNTSIEVYDTSTSTFVQQDFQYGRGYVYPFIDYGQQFLLDDTNFGQTANTTNNDITIFHVLNYRPAIYVTEYLNRIFNQQDLAGWSYEIKGDYDFKKKFNTLIIPYADEKLQYKFNTDPEHGYTFKFETPTGTTQTQNDLTEYLLVSDLLCTLSDKSSIPTDTIVQPINLASGTSSYLLISRNITANGSLLVDLSDIVNTDSSKFTFYIQLVSRNASTNSALTDDVWNTVIAEKSFVVNGNQTYPAGTITIPIADNTEFKSNTNLAVRVKIKTSVIGSIKSILSFTINDVLLNIPGDTSTPFTAEVIYPTDGTNYDVITPKPPENIKQIDFLKSIMQLFNLYAYTENKNPKHLIFQKYDDFYALADSINIKTNAADWTNKIDYETFKIISNVTLPKSYLFTYKDDSDWVNDKYKAKFNEPYGTFSFTDSNGVQDESKIELVFSSTPIISVVGTNRYFPALYTGDLINKSSTATNIRILYYNGLKPCTDFDTYTDQYDASNTRWALGTFIFTTSSYYPQATPYYFDATNSYPIETLNFGRSKEYFFPADGNYINADTAYTSYYKNQITELTNVNMFTIEAQVWLNEFDISNLDLKVPVFIDLGDFGHAYFKILKVEYNDNKTSSLCTFQKIYLGALS
jgi:hypothetical protein